jgi:hypothetical protein
MTGIVRLNDSAEREAAVLKTCLLNFTGFIVGIVGGLPFVIRLHLRE